MLFLSVTFILAEWLLYSNLYLLNGYCYCCEIMHARLCIVCHNSIKLVCINVILF